MVNSAYKNITLCMNVNYICVFVMMMEVEFSVIPKQFTIQNSIHFLAYMGLPKFF